MTNIAGGLASDMDGFAYLDAWDIVPRTRLQTAQFILIEGTALLAAEIRDEVLRLVE